MVLPVQQFRPSTGEEVSPISAMIKSIIGGYGQGLQYKQQNQNIKSQEQDMKRQQILLDSLPEQIKQQLLQSQADLAARQADTDYKKTMTQFIPQEYDLSRRRTDLADLNYALSKQRLEAYTGPERMAYLYANTDQGKAAIANNPDLSAAYNRMIAGNASQADFNLLNKFIQPKGQMQPQQVQSMPVVPASFANLTNEQKNQIVSKNSGIDVNNEQSNKIRDYLQSMIEEKTVGADVTKQRRFAVSARNMYDDISKRIPKISQFAGLQGTTEGKFNGILSAMGISPTDAYREFNSFTETELPIFAKELGRGLGQPAAVEATKMMKELSNPVSSFADMQQAIKNWNALGNMMTQNEKALSQSTSESQKTLKDMVFKNKNVPQGTLDVQKTIIHEGKTYTEAELEKIAAGEQ